MHRPLILMVLPLTLGLSGCLATLENGPKRLYTEEAQAQQLAATLAPPDFSRPYPKEERNGFITARMYAIDLSYTAYFASLTKERQLGTLGADLTVIGLGAATTVIGGAQTKAVLGAATAAIAGGKSAVDKDILLSQTVQILQNEMETSRTEIRLRISKSLEKEPADYTIAQGLSDLEEYYRAGTLAGALKSLSSTVGTQTRKAEQAKDIAAFPKGQREKLGLPEPEL